MSAKPLAVARARRRSDGAPVADPSLRSDVPSDVRCIEIEKDTLGELRKARARYEDAMARAEAATQEARDASAVFEHYKARLVESRGLVEGDVIRLDDGIVELRGHCGKP